MPKWTILFTTLLITALIAAGCRAASIPAPTATDQPTDQPCPEAETLGYQVEELERRNAELKAWADQLAAGYGPGVWYFNPDGTAYPVFDHAASDPTLEGVASELNELLADEVAPQIILDGVEGKAVRVQVTDDAALTQRLGSAGAQAYLQVVLYSLTSLPEIDCVDFDFQEGDHAQPGLYCR
jgi:hypothetical protein